jgi:predicted Zn-dependent protease
MVLPVLGLLDMAYFAVGPVSNHLQYLALAAPSALVAAGLALLHRRQRLVAAGIGIALALALVATTHRRAAAFEDDLSLWAAAVRESPRSLYAAVSYSEELGARRSLADAVRELEAFVHRTPDAADRHLARSHRAIFMRQPAEAAREAIAAERLRRDVQRQIEIARIMVSTGSAAEAIPILALQIENAPRSADVRYWLAAALVRTGHPDQARQAVLDGLRIAPHDPKLRQAIDRLDGKSQDASSGRETRR